MDTPGGHRAATPARVPAQRRPEQAGLPARPVVWPAAPGGAATGPAALEPPAPVGVLRGWALRLAGHRWPRDRRAAPGTGADLRGSPASVGLHRHAPANPASLTGRLL